MHADTLYFCMLTRFTAHAERAMPMVSSHSALMMQRVSHIGAARREAHRPPARSSKACQHAVVNRVSTLYVLGARSAYLDPF
jgi:hypothetical protein